MHGIVTTAETVVEHYGFVAVLPYDMHERLGCRDIDMLFVVAVFYENQPGLYTSGGGTVDCGLHGGIVARAVGSYNSIVETRIRTHTLHCSEC